MGESQRNKNGGWFDKKAEASNERGSACKNFRRRKSTMGEVESSQIEANLIRSGCPFF
jgi:hypothetical protein